MEFVRQILMKLKTSSNEGLLMKVFSHSLMWLSKHCSGHYVTTQVCTLISWGCVHLRWCGALEDYTLCEMSSSNDKPRWFTSYQQPTTMRYMFILPNITKCDKENKRWPTLHRQLFFLRGLSVVGHQETWTLKLSRTKALMNIMKWIIPKLRSIQIYCI